MIVEVRVLGKVADAAADRDVANGPSEDLGVAARGKHELHQQLQRRRLAGTVGAQETEHVTGRDLDRERVECAVGARPPETDLVVLGKVVRANRGLHD